MNAILYDANALAARARNLGALNGIDFAVMTLDSASPPAYGDLELHFYNDQHLADLVAAASTPAAMRALLPVSGGERILGGAMSGQVQVTSLAHSGAGVLTARLAPVGDYSRYTLTILQTGFDPIFASFVFRFRPGCFNTNCQPRPLIAPAVVEPAIHYLAKDYDSFRHVMIAAMMQRVPNWQAETEASLDVTLIDLISAAADELSDYQDRVMAEGFWPTAQKRISLRRHARLMAYYPYEGNQASTMLALNFPGAVGYAVAAGTAAWSGTGPGQFGSVPFVTASAAYVHGLFSQVELYTWSDAIPALAAGATTADLAFSSGADASHAQALIANGSIARLLIQEWLNPATGMRAGVDPTHRQVVRLTEATLLSDPLTGASLVRVTWRDEDALTSNFCFVASIGANKIANLSLFHGNLLDLVQGASQSFQYVPPGATLGAGQYHFQATRHGFAQCKLPPAFPVLWTKTAADGYTPPVSTVRVTAMDASGAANWSEQPDLIHSDGVEDRDFVVEVDEDLRALVRFGDGTNGLALADDTVVTISWLSGYGPDGNIGKDSIVGFDATGIPEVGQGVLWNPFDVTDGAAPESPDVIRRNVPQAFAYHQQRAVTLADYVAQAEAIAGVQRAAAVYRWTGSWRTVRVSVDPAGTTTLSQDLRATVERALDAVHLIGEDIEVRAPEYVPLKIALTICISADFWIDDVASVVEQAFSNGYDENGTPAFFHPDRWSFGQALYASQIEGMLATIQGVEHVVSIAMSRWSNSSIASNEVMTMGPEEIVLVSNDPNNIEEGTIAFVYRGGRQ
jgi:Baseplate J-like protein